eukprot:scaffold114397_cov28-Tisochrysis_lutea.AAC.1
MSSSGAPKGLILVGGLGTQLRPLTLSKPKALIEFGNRPLLLHFIDALSRAGVNEVVLAINYRPQIMRQFLDQYQDAYGIKITCLQEDEPLGTAGPIALAHAQGLLDDKEPFFVINCDVACDFNLRALYNFHKQHGKMGTIMVTRVDEPAKCAHLAPAAALCCSPLRQRHPRIPTPRFLEQIRQVSGPG